MAEYKPIPIGIEDFREIIDKGYCFVDKTLIIRDILDSASKVTLFTRPRRFGKTLNMSMLRRYFERTDEDNSYLFDGLKIAGAGEKYKKYMGQYPVISISLKSMKQLNYEEAFVEFKNLVANEIWRHKELLNSDILMPASRNKLEMICNGTADDTVYSTSLKLLSGCLREVYNKNVIVLIDEYDVPLENAYFNGFYDKMVNLIRSVFESALKTNDSLEFAVLTGCLRISKESIFTGLNNPKVYSVSDAAFSQYFGFTEQEVRELVEYYNLSERFDEIKTWYDGYRFGKTEIYNPWSLLNFIDDTIADDSCIPDAYWVNTSSNSIIHELIVKSDRRIRDDIETLIRGDSIDKPLYKDITYVNMNVKSDYIWSFLLHTGYLKSIKIYKKGIQTYFTAVIPNLEITAIYESTFRQWFDESIRAADKSVFFNAVIDGNAEIFELEVKKWLLKSISYHDGYENFYHGFLAGLLEYSDEYLVESNRESGIGRSDIIIKNVLTKEKAVVIEIKSVRKKDGETLDGQCNEALKQIVEKQYEVNLKNEGYSNIVKYGIAFLDKECKVKKADK
ncbi:MAG: ATP-binding protein [Lachnospiraceae bacterium]|nr:ATP-binding protein [Lachnospiraceae bacterium]MCM1230795.1 ATP-binding protein [Ruminococcus flavefaciens]